jgi:Family of unknown function (DUF6252)
MLNSMKKILLLVSIACALIACESTEDNTPAFQANLDNDFYRALDAEATVGGDGTLAIVGSTSDQTITLFLSVLQSGTFEFNSGNGHQAFYEDPTGQIYSTEFGGGGVVNITDREADGNGFISGDFTFTAILQGIDTVTVSRGLFYQVPVNSGTNEEPQDPDGALLAEIDGEAFEPSTVVANTTDTSIEINGALGDDTIQLLIPLDATPGAQAIPGGGFNAIYFIAGEEEPAISGTIEVIAHDMTAQTISGTFTFTTENHEITLGQFNVAY